MSREKRLYLLDGYALIYRAYFAFSKNPRMTSDGKNVSAVFGYVNTLIDLMRNDRPTHLGLVLDAPGPTFRAKEHDFYKANREAMPEDIRSAIPFIKEITEAFKIPILIKDTYEADDIIGTVAKDAAKNDFDVFMVTSDKDFGQLVEEHIFMHKPAGRQKPKQIMGIKEICERWQIERVEQLIDILGLMGDASDNIPGVPGVGEKTAIKLLKAYGSIDGLYENVGDLKGKLKEKVENNKEQAYISRKLATIILDVPIDYKLEEFILEAPDREKLIELFGKLEFRTLGKRLFGDAFSVNQAGAQTTAKEGTEAKSTDIVKAKKKAPTGQLNLFGEAPVNQVNAALMDADSIMKGRDISNTKHDYKLVDTEAKQKDLLEKLLKQKAVSFDTETTSIDANNAELVGIAFSYKEGKAFYVPVSEEQKEAQKTVDLFKPFFSNEKIKKIGQNLKYDLLVLKWYGVEVKGAIEDTMLEHYLIEPETRHNLDFLSETYLGYTPVSIESLIGKKGKKQGTMRDVEPEKVTEYAGEDADLALQLHHKFKPILKENGFQKLYEEVEAPLIPILADMEFEGVRLDTDFLEEYAVSLNADIEHLKATIFEKSEEEFNLDSPKQLGTVLFDNMGIPYKGKKTKTGQYSTSEDVLQKLATTQPIIEKILEYRSLNKLKNTYVDALPKLVNEKTSRIHTTFNQAVAATGRLSSTNPNLQNIPIRTERGREIRKAFIPRDKDHTILAADYSQIELRIIAQISEDKSMLKAFKDGLDIHTATASKVYGIEMDAVDSTMRRYAKMVNFGIIYGISAFGLSQRLGIKRKEAKILIDAYFNEYTEIRTYMTEAVEKARRLGYAETILGRRRYLKDINSRNHTVRSFAERNSINAPIQGSAADMIKMAMIKVSAEMQKRSMKSKMILQVHDELLFDAHLSELEELKQLVEENMINAIKMKVPIEVGMGTGANWLEAH